jgi:hypothetical protein
MAERMGQEQERDLSEEGTGRGMGYDKPESPLEAAPFIASVMEALEGLEFPATKEDVLLCAGDQEVQYRDQRVSIKKVIEGTGVEQFSSMANVVQTIRDELERKDVNQGR